MQTRNPLFDDLSRLMTSAAGTFQGARDEMEGLVRTRLERILADMDLVDRESFETVREMAAEARLENERLAAELADLKTELAALKKAKPAPRRKSPAAAKKSAPEA
ncbi:MULTISPECIES: accessory factor UbiK family protein [unclassified Minwuia]|jgi:BMFP domain-containing protein YqiC|uniref:accessory factor UbiK family protein n=1 Tax=unclassified Minwuia TaxID=2618799 RepID=UPI0024797043|nr:MULTISPECIES: accessory factor UbiK family protein [unclassified Minwuia]